ncbi:MAG: ATP-binding protein [Desulfuromonadaceae bacterium]|nr:ATP-binding protein [Desulfuromonadaceae bacterium]MDD2847260.1 ATP-binding protein [Desulfuromonadaceae bacterium]MDD4130204.1 ATP-binding protein [Desulfuromonadaceae bacterium]
MKIRTRLHILTAASATLVVIMALLFYWSQQRLATANRAKNLADKIVSSVFERKSLNSSYLSNDYQDAKDQWLSKQKQISDLLKTAPTDLVSISDREIFIEIEKDLEGSSAVFLQILSNRESARNGVRPQAQANETETRLVGQLLLKFLDTIAESHKLQKASDELIAATQKTAAWVSLSIIVTIALFMIIVAWSLGRIISKGIKNLQQGAAAIGAGNLHHTIPSVAGDEFASVAIAFNTMSGKLAESHAALERDIVARKRAAGEIEGLNQELNKTVSQLQGANQELEAFAYSVSHDLRAPLRAMGGFSEALVEDFGDKLEAEARDYLDEIVIGSRHMGQLIDGLLTLSRSTRGELLHDQVDLSAMTGRIRIELEKSEPLRRVEWQVEAGLSTGGDARMIEVIMRNLLDNAWKYTSDTAEPLIRVYAETAESELFYCVADNGAGFDMAHAGKLFQPFQRLHRQDEFPGIGIGLATAQRIVHRHGGTFHATGIPHKGATFRFSLPYGKEQFKPPPPNLLLSGEA